MRQMAFHRPATVGEAVALLAADPGALCMAGGATLVALLNARLVEPSALVRLRGIPGLDGIERRADGALRIGAMTRHRTTAESALLGGGLAALRQAAGVIANPPVRNMGTMGGSVAFADPAADYLPALAALDAAVELTGPAGSRRLGIGAFIVDWYATARAADELVTAIHLPAPPRGAAGLYDKLARVEGDYATASVAVVLAMRDGACAHLAVAVGGCGPRPVRVPAAEQALVGAALDDAGLRRLGAALSEACDPVDDMRGSAAYRRRVVPRMVVRAVRRAMQPLERAA